MFTRLFSVQCIIDASHWHLCHCCKGSNQYGAWAAPAVTPHQDGACGQCYFCHGGAKRCLEEVKIAPINPTFLAPIRHGVMSSHTAPSANHTRAETIPTESSNHELIEGMVSVPGGVGWWRCEFLWRAQQKLMLLAIAGSQWETSWFEVKFQTQTSTKIPLESSYQGLSIGVIQTWWFLCQIIYNYNCWRYKILLVAIVFGSAQTRQ